MATFTGLSFMWLFREPCYEAASEELFMRAACAVILITALLATSTPAGANDTLPPGKPAGTQQAQSVATIGSVVLGAAALLGAFLAVQSGGAAAISSGTPPLNAANRAAFQAAALNTAK
jgi:hypothetical protein